MKTHIIALFLMFASPLLSYAEENELTCKCWNDQTSEKVYLEGHLAFEVNTADLNRTEILALLEYFYTNRYFLAYKFPSIDTMQSSNDTMIVYVKPFPRSLNSPRSTLKRAIEAGARDALAQSGVVSVSCVTPPKPAVTGSN